VATLSSAALVSAYADRFDRALSDGSQSIGSPLGAWLLLALVAPAATGAARDAIEEALGASAVDAFRVATDLLETPHPAVQSALALWHRDEFLRPTFHDWLRTMPPSTETGRVPTQAEADAWATRTTDGIIDAFPVELDPSVAIVVANALATRIEWVTPFDLAPAARLASPWSEQISRVLWARPDESHMVIAHTERAGDVAVHLATSDRGLSVVSVMADPRVPPVDVRAAALDASIMIVRRSSPSILAAPSGARVRSLFDLPLGNSPCWEITEYQAPVGRGPGPESFEAFLPSWTATSRHDLLASGPALGFPAAAEALGRFVVEHVRDGFEAKQVATATFHRRGFEAAAITAVASRALGMRVEETTTNRHAKLRFGHPYAVVAVATDKGGGPWHGVPVFSAWVSEPVDSAPS
jgi:hypothetical protein